MKAMKPKASVTIVGGGLAGTELYSLYDFCWSALAHRSLKAMEVWT
ncbi:MAG: hypothetical protein ACE5I9_01405 [Candidatus Methylomirabilales bacterium]